MSSATTVALIESYYRMFNAGDIDGMLSLMTSNIAHDINESLRESGAPAFKSFLARMNEHYAETASELCVMTDTKGVRASAEFMIDGIYKKTATGLPPAHQQRYRLPVGAFFEIEHDKISRVTNYYNLAEWIRQVS